METAHTADRLVVSMLTSCPKAWAPLDRNSLSETETKSLFDLVAAGLIARRTGGRLTMLNSPTSAEYVITFTGEGYKPGQSPLEQIGAATWHEWEQSWMNWQESESKGNVPFVSTEIPPCEWRLTSQGELAIEDCYGGRSGMVCDFVLKRDFFSSRQPVSAIASLDSFEFKKPQPAGAHGVDWQEGASVLLPQIAELFKQFAAKPQTEQAPGGVVDELKMPTGVKGQILLIIRDKDRPNQRQIVAALDSLNGAGAGSKSTVGKYCAYLVRDGYIESSRTGEGYALTAEAQKLFPAKKRAKSIRK